MSLADCMAYDAAHVVFAGVDSGEATLYQPKDGSAPISLVAVWGVEEKDERSEGLVADRLPVALPVASLVRNGEPLEPERQALLVRYPGQGPFEETWLVGTAITRPDPTKWVVEAVRHGRARPNP